MAHQEIGLKLHKFFFFFFPETTDIYFKIIPYQTRGMFEEFGYETIITKLILL